MISDIWLGSSELVRHIQPLFGVLAVVVFGEQESEWFLNLFDGRVSVVQAEIRCIRISLK